MEECSRAPYRDDHGETERAPSHKGNSKERDQNNLPTPAGKRSKDEAKYRKSAFICRHDISSDLDTIQGYLVPIIRAGIIRILNPQRRKCLPRQRQEERPGNRRRVREVALLLGSMRVEALIRGLCPLNAGWRRLRACGSLLFPQSGGIGVADQNHRFPYAARNTRTPSAA